MLSSDPKAAKDTRYPWLAVYNGLHDEVREYLLGLLALRMGDARAAARHTAALEMREGAEARGFAQSLRARTAVANRQVDRALHAFEAARFRTGEGFLESEFGSQAAERWERAELLFKSGRHDEALAWYNSLPEISIAGMVYLAPVQLRSAQITERRRQPALAAQHYRAFIRLWQHADVELRPQVMEARRRLAGLK